MRAFRVVSVLNPQDLGNCFTVHGGLKHPHKGELFRSWREAAFAAEQAAQCGWYGFVVRRLPEGWQCVECVAPA